MSHSSLLEILSCGLVICFWLAILPLQPHARVLLDDGTASLACSVGAAAFETMLRNTAQRAERSLSSLFSSAVGSSLEYVAIFYQCTRHFDIMSM
jgi:hypothetical protein